MWSQQIHILERQSLKTRLDFIWSQVIVCVINNLLRFSFVDLWHVLWGKANVSRYNNNNRNNVFNNEPNTYTQIHTFWSQLFEKLYAYIIFCCAVWMQTMAHTFESRAYIALDFCHQLELEEVERKNNAPSNERVSSQSRQPTVCPHRNMFVLFMNKFILTTFSKFSLDFKVSVFYENAGL